MRATAKLHLLSPAVFPLPFGAKIPPVKFASAEANTQVASITAAEAASSADDLTAVSEAQQTQHAQHAQQSPYGSQTDLKFQAPAVSVTNGQVKLSVPDGATAGLTAQHAQHAQQAVSTPVNGKSKARTPAALGGKLRIGGPVTKLVGSSKGLAVVQGDELDAKPQSLGTLKPVSHNRAAAKLLSYVAPALLEACTCYTTMLCCAQGPGALGQLTLGQWGIMAI